MKIEIVGDFKDPDKTFDDILAIAVHIRNGKTEGTVDNGSKWKLIKD